MFYHHHYLVISCTESLAHNRLKRCCSCSFNNRLLPYYLRLVSPRRLHVSDLFRCKICQIVALCEHLVLLTASYDYIHLFTFGKFPQIFFGLGIWPKHVCDALQAFIGKYTWSLVMFLFVIFHVSQL